MGSVARLLSEPLPRCHDYPSLDTLNLLGRSLSLPQKKEIMTALRIGLAPRRSRRQRSKKPLTTHRNEPVHLRDRLGNQLEVITMHDVWYILDPFLSSPVKRSLLSMLLRASPTLPGEGVSAVQEGLKKELEVTQRLDLQPSLCYPFLLSNELCATSRSHPDLPFRPYVNLALRTRFLRWRAFQVPSLFLVPQCSYKSVGMETRDQFFQLSYPHLQTWQLPTHQVSTSHLESLYARTGMVAEGPCEVRYAWKYNDLKPRVYYAIGGSAYHAAKLVRPIFDSLCALSRSTNPTTRYSFAGFPLLDFSSDIFVIYDYSAFTSRLVDFKGFVDELAVYLQGVKVTTFDTKDGIKEEDVGQILQYYNDVCNKDGAYSLTRLSKSSDGQPTVICHHHVAGMLGVFGNIVGSTALHGIVGVQICGADENGNFIGDDAGIVCTEVGECGKDWVFAGIRTIGDIADPKFEIFEANDEDFELGDSWHYTKRPIHLSKFGIEQGWMPEFPIIAQARAQRPDHVTVETPSIILRRRIFIRQVARYLNALHQHQSEVSESDWGIVLSILKRCYQELGLSIHGSLPKREYRYQSRPPGDPFHVVPPLKEEVLKEGWWNVLKQNTDHSGLIQLPRLDGADDLPSVLEEGCIFHYRGNKVLALLEKIGVVSKQVVYQERMITEETLELLDMYLQGSIRPVYTYQVLESYEPWSSYFLWSNPSARY